MTTLLTEVKERPISFTKRMLQAIKENKKSQTRRVMRVQPDPEFQKYPIVPWLVDGVQQYTDSGLTLFISDYMQGMTQSYACPYGKVGDHLYVKSSRFMRKVEAEVWLEITGLKSERLQDISNNDIRREGVHISTGYQGQIVYPSPHDDFEKLWDSINGKRPGCTWADNPFVWVISFKRIEA